MKQPTFEEYLDYVAFVEQSNTIKETPNATIVTALVDIMENSENAEDRVAAAEELSKYIPVYEATIATSQDVDTIIEEINEILNTLAEEADKDLTYTPDAKNTDKNMTMIEEVLTNFLAAVPKGSLPTLEETKVIALLDDINYRYNS